MVYEPNLRERSKDLINARNWGVRIVTGFLGLGILITEVQRIRALSKDINNYAYIVLIIVCLSLIGLWIWATQKELDILFFWLDPERYKPPSTIKETVIIIGLGLLIVGLVYASRNPLIFGIVFSLYNVFLYYCFIKLNNEITDAIFKSRERLKKDMNESMLKHRAKIYEDGISIIEKYFIFRPHSVRLLLIMAIGFIGFGLSIHYDITGNKNTELAAYLTYIVIIVISEVYIGMWRSVRDDKLRPLETYLYDINRDIK